MPEQKQKNLTWVDCVIAAEVINIIFPCDPTDRESRPYEPIDFAVSTSIKPAFKCNENYLINLSQCRDFDDLDAFKSEVIGPGRVLTNDEEAAWYSRQFELFSTWQEPFHQMGEFEHLPLVELLARQRFWELFDPNSV